MSERGEGGKSLAPVHPSTLLVKIVFLVVTQFRVPKWPGRCSLRKENFLEGHWRSNFRRDRKEIALKLVQPQ